MASPYKSKIYLVVNVNCSSPKLSTLLTELLSPHTRVPVSQVLYSVWKSLLLGTVRPEAFDSYAKYVQTFVLCYETNNFKVQMKVRIYCLSLARE